MKDRLKYIEGELSRLLQEVHRMQLSAGEENVAQQEDVQSAFVEQKAEQIPIDPEADAKLSERWLSRIGILIILLGAVYLFYYSIEQGWVNPIVRVLAGIGLSAGLMSAGLKLMGERPQYAALLQGGGIGVAFITLFASSQLYFMISLHSTLAIAAAISGISFWLAVRQKMQSLAIVAIIGAMLSPWTLYSMKKAVVPIACYLMTVLMGSRMIYLKRGWEALSWTEYFGSLFVWWTLFQQNAPWIEHQIVLKVWMESVFVFSFLAFWVLPQFRQKLHAINPMNWPVSASASGAHTFFLCFVSLLTFLLSKGLWQLESQVEIYCSFGIGLAMIGLGFLSSKSENFYLYSTMHYINGMLFGLLGVFSIPAGNLRFSFISFFTCVCYEMAQKNGNQLFVNLSRAISYFMAFSLLFNIVSGVVSSRNVANGDAVCYAFNIALWLLLSRLSQFKQEKLVFFGISHLSFLGTSFIAFNNVEAGNAIVTATWVIWSILLLIFGFWQKASFLYKTGLYTVVATACKLFFFDHFPSDGLARIALFLGVGGLLLATSYFLRKLTNLTSLKNPQAGYE